MKLPAIIAWMQNIPQAVKGAFDVTALITVLMGWLTIAQVTLTIVSTIAGIVWLLIRIWETETVKAWHAARKARKNA